VATTDTAEIPTVVPHDGVRTADQTARNAASSAPAEEERMSRADAPAPKARARHAHLFVTHVDPWSVMKNAFMLSIAIGIVLIVAVTVLWAMLSLSGTLDSVTRTLNDFAGGGANSIDAAGLFSFSRVVGLAAVMAALEIILLTALATLFAFLFNLSVGLTGGLQVTLTDDS
jgi:hypothetical protein